MLRECVAPVVLICATAVSVIAALHAAAALYSRYETIQGRLESERWLVVKCRDPDFFTNMHQHTDLCISVENNARVGALMLALRDVTRDFLEHHVASRVGWPELSLPALCTLLCAAFWWPSWGRPPRRWPQCRDDGLKQA